MQTVSGALASNQKQTLARAGKGEGQDYITWQLTADWLRRLANRQGPSQTASGWTRI